MRWGSERMCGIRRLDGNIWGLKCPSPPTLVGEMWLKVQIFATQSGLVEQARLPGSQLMPLQTARNAGTSALVAAGTFVFIPANQSQGCSFQMRISYETSFLGGFEETNKSHLGGKRVGRRSWGDRVT